MKTALLRVILALLAISTPAMAEGNFFQGLFQQGVDGIKSIKEKFIKDEEKQEPSPTPKSTVAPASTPAPEAVATPQSNPLLDQVEEIKKATELPSPQQAEEMQNALLEIQANGAELIGKDIKFAAYILASPGMISESAMLTSTWPYISNGTFADYSKLNAEQKRVLLGHQGKIVHLRATVRRAKDGEVGPYIVELTGAFLTKAEVAAQPTGTAVKQVTPPADLADAEAQEHAQRDNEAIAIKQPKKRTLKTLSASDQRIFWKVIKKASDEIDADQITQATQTLNSIPEILQYEPMVIAGWAFVYYRKGDTQKARWLVKQVYASPYCSDSEASFLKREFAKEERRITQ